MTPHDPGPRRKPARRDRRGRRGGPSMTPAAAAESPDRGSPPHDGELTAAAAGPMLVTRAGKAYWMRAATAKFAAAHPLGKATPLGPVVVLEPGPPVVPGEVLERNRSIEAAGDR